MSKSYVQPSVPKAVPSAVAFSANNTVPVLTEPQLGPYEPMTGSPHIPRVAVTDVGEAPPQPGFTAGGSGTVSNPGTAAAPSLPLDGFLFRKGIIDPHYQVPVETVDPYHRVNSLHTVGWWTRVQEFANHIAYNQVTTETGFKVSGPQQRTSVMRNQLPAHGNFGTQTYIPRQMPQAVQYNRIRPSLGTDKYGTGVLNRDTFGAGQVAGGIGGNTYTPPPAPPVANAVTAPPASVMPTWG